MALPTFKLEPALRIRFAADDPGPFSVIVQPLARLSDLDLRKMNDSGLLEATGGDLRGAVSRDALTKLIEASWVGYVYDADITVSAGANNAPRTPFVPAKPAKRGHTKLPPRRD